MGADLTELDQEQENEHLRRKVRLLEGQLARAGLAPKMLKEANAEIAALVRQVDVLTALDGIEVSPPEWAQPSKSKRGHRATANLILSDLHLDEVVDPAQMRGVNAYNRDIALMRLKRLGENTVKMARDYISGVSYDGLFLWANGDFVSGNIHDELRRTNAADVIDTIDYWVDPVAALFDQLADFFGKVHVISTVGNHGRSTQKPQAKGSVRSSFDWLFMRSVWREFRSDKRFTWNIAESKDARETCYRVRYRCEHGDDLKGGDQIAGPLRPVAMADFRGTVLEASMPGGEPFDCQVISHFHRYTPLPRAKMNGSLVGYTEYGKGRKYPWEPPQQAFWLTTPEHGASLDMPIRCSDPVREGWGK